MTYGEFIAAITSEAPSLDDYKQVVQFTEAASIEVLWSALFTAGIHTLFISVINKTLQEKVAQANLEAAMSNISRKIKP